MNCRARGVDGPSFLDGEWQLRTDVLQTPIFRTVEHIVLGTFANEPWTPGILRAYVHGEMVRERSTVVIVGG